MAKKPSSPAAPEAPAYDPQATYDVAFARVVKRGAHKFLPRLEHQISGTLLSKIAEEEPDAIASAIRR